MTGRGERRVLRDFVRLCHAYGRDPLLAQAAGGNLSAKLDATRLLIKASGVRLREVGDRFGWTVIDYGSVTTGLARLGRRGRAGARRELAYAELLRGASHVADVRPSMEAGFHAALPQRWVAHLHSVAGMILGALAPAESRRVLAEYWPQACPVQFVPARLPGAELSLELRQRSERTRESGLYVWVLRNHGLVWAAHEVHVLRAAIRSFESGMRRAFSLDRYPRLHRAGSPCCRRRARRAAEAPAAGEVATEVCACRWPRASLPLRPLFPDFMIYFTRATRLEPGAPSEDPRPDLARTSETSVRITARTRGALRDKADVFYAHALFASVLAERGVAIPHLTPRLAVRVRTLETEVARLRLLAAASPPLVEA